MCTRDGRFAEKCHCMKRLNDYMMALLPMTCDRNVYVMSKQNVPCNSVNEADESVLR